jgi:hypothetical protein
MFAFILLGFMSTPADHWRLSVVIRPLSPEEDRPAREATLDGGGAGVGRRDWARHAERSINPRQHRNGSHAMTAQTVILRPSPFSGLPSAMVVLMTILILLGIVAHAAVL